MGNGEIDLPIALWQGLSSMTADQIADVEVQKLPFVGLRNARCQAAVFLETYCNRVNIK